MAVETKIQFRRDTASNWSTVNPTLAAGEIGYVTSGTDTWGKAGYFKIGDGINAWKALSLAKAGTADAATVATTAGKLTTPVTINGTSFDGSANVAVKGAVYGTGYSKITVKSGSTGPTSPVEGDVWISF
jgi:hypothetical protein